MVQGINKEYIFNNKKNIEEYLKLLNKYIKDYQVTFIAYCIMNNHTHLLTYTEKIEELGKFMHKVNLMYSQFYNRENNRCGMVFRNRYKTEPIYSLKHLINCIQYIHLNPVKAQMVKKCEDYPYSSYNQYINNGKITKSTIMKEVFGENCNYLEIFDCKIKYKFLDIEKTKQDDIREYIDYVINDFIIEHNIGVEELLSDKEVLCNLIHTLKNEYNFQYIDIMKKFDISKNIMNKIK